MDSAFGEGGAEQGSTTHAATSDLAAALVRLCCLLKCMEGQSHLIHLNYRGANFLGVHEFLKGQYEAHLEQFDTVAEFVRSMDYWMPKNETDLHGQGVQADFEEVDSYDGVAMLTTYVLNLQRLGEKAKTLEPQAQQVREIDVANYLAELVSVSYKAAWFLKATLQG